MGDSWQKHQGVEFLRKHLTEVSADLYEARAMVLRLVLASYRDGWESG